MQDPQDICLFVSGPVQNQVLFDYDAAHAGGQIFTRLAAHAVRVTANSIKHGFQGAGITQGLRRSPIDRRMYRNVQKVGLGTCGSR